MGRSGFVASVALTSRAILRRSRPTTIVLGVVLAAIGGATIAALAGARRTESAYPRLVESTNSTDVNVVPVVGTVDFDLVEQLPQVAESGLLLAFQIEPRREVVDSPEAFASADGRLFYEIGRPQVLDGRPPRRNAPDEIMVNEAMASEFDLRPGRTYRGDLIDFPALSEFVESGRPPIELDLDAIQTPVEFRVVGVERSLEAIIPVEDARGDSIMTVSAAFAERYGDQAVTAAMAVRLRDPERDLHAFQAEVRERFPEAVIEFPLQEDKRETVERSVRPYAYGLYLFAAVIGFTGLLVLGQVVVRQVALDGADVPTYRALGMSRARSVAALLARTLLIAITGAVGAVIVASAASPFFPFGQARRAEPDPGFDLNVGILAVGALAIVVLVLGWAGFAAWRVTRVRPAGEPGVGDATRPSTVAARLANAGLPPAPTTGVRFALERHGVLAGPVTTLTALALAIAAMTATLGFAASLDRVLSTPRFYGWNWDVSLEGYDGTSDAIAEQVEDDGDLTAKTSGARTVLRVGSEDLRTFAFTHGPGAVEPTIVDGRLPSRPDEIALGARSLRDLDASIGDTVVAEGASRGRFRVVGTAVLPVLARGGTVGLAEGAALTLEGLERIEPAPDQSFIAADLVPGATLREMRDRYDLAAAVESPQPPSELVSYQRLDRLPEVLTVVLAVLAASVLSHAVVTSIRRRRRAVAVLKVLGFVRPQVGVAVATEATTLAALGVLVGVPMGLVVGRWGWSAFADRLGVVVEPVTPFPFGVMAVAVGALVLANLVAALPSRSAARTHPAQALRSE